MQNWIKNILDKYKVKINPKAIRELDHIYEYIANEKLAPENAKGQIERIKKSILSLDTFPQSHQERSEGRYAGKGYLELSKGSAGIPHCEAYRCSSCKKILIDYANR